MLTPIQCLRRQKRTCKYFKENVRSSTTTATALRLMRVSPSRLASCHHFTELHFCSCFTAYFAKIPLRRTSVIPHVDILQNSLICIVCFLLLSSLALVSVSDSYLCRHMCMHIFSLLFSSRGKESNFAKLARTSPRMKCIDVRMCGFGNLT